MPDWVPDEVKQIAPLLREIDAFQGPRRRRINRDTLQLPLSQAIPLLQGLGGNTRALIIRQLCQLLEFDEHRHLQWRVEHKLVQALILNHYCPGVMPVTRGLDLRLLRTGISGFRRSLHEEYPNGFYIKSALGDSSGERSDCDRTHIILDAIERGHRNVTRPPTLIEEMFVIQERIPIAREYRIHTIEDRFLEDLTFLRYGRGNIPGERDRPNAYVQSILDKLPDGIVAGSLCGWDVALTFERKFHVIEVNFSGFHPVYKRGFHCSGFYHDPDWGASLTARLLRHLENADGVKVVVQPDTEDYPSEQRFYADVIHWQERLKNEP
jgi:hypothetical protein